MALAVQQITESNVASAGTSHTINFTQTTGDLVIIIFGTAVSVSLSTVGDSFTDWTAATDTIHVLKKILDGSEGGNMVITTSASTKSASIAYNISGAINTAQTDISSLNSATSTTPDSFSLSPTWGTTYISTLWITAFRQAGEEIDDDTWVTGTPTNYSSLTQKTSGTSGTPGTNCQVASAHRIVASASEDPGSFTTAQSLAWKAYTIAVRPIPTITVTGTITPSATESDVVAGGKTLVVTVSNENLIAAGAGSFGLQRQNIINGLDATSSPTNGWNNVVQATQDVAGVTRTSDTVYTVTFDSFGTYDISATETINVECPDTVLVNYNAGGVIFNSAFTVTSGAVRDAIGLGVLPWKR